MNNLGKDAERDIGKKNRLVSLVLLIELHNLFVVIS